MSTEITITSTTIDINVTESPITIEAPSGAYPLPTSVYSVFGRTGNIVATEGDYTLTQLAGVTITSPVSGQALVYNGTSWVNNTETYVGTVTSVSALTLGTTGTDLTSSVVNSTTTPVITLNVPTASASNRGALSSADWSIFNAKQPALSGTGFVKIIGTTISYDNSTYYLASNPSAYIPLTALSSTATGLTYTNTTGVFSTTAGYSIPTTASQTTWDAAYNDKINSAAVTGTTTKTLTLNQQDGGTVTASWTDDNTDAVTSVFGRTGAVVSANGDYTTTQVTEGTNLYYTDVRARASNSFVAGSGAYNSTTGVITIPTNNNQITNGAAYITLTSLSASAPLSYSNTTGAFSISQANTSTDGYLSSFDWNTFNNKQIALTLGNLTSSDITVTGGTGAVVGTGSTLTLATVNTNVGAYGTSTSVPTITVNGKGLVTAASQTAIPTASSSVTGLLTSANWSTFNDKQNQLNGTGFVKASGTTITYDNSTYLTTIEGIAAGGELSGTYASPSLVNSAVTGKVLTGVNVTGGSISATDSILTAFGKVQNQINGLIGGSIYKGTWNASTNTPTLASGVGTAGNYYIVSVAGTTNLDGITDWQVGDWAIFQGSVWQKVDNTDAVVSVNGFTGAVSLTTSNINEGTNLYYTDARARLSVSGGTGISYNSTSGVITNSAPDQTVTLTGAGTTSISGTYPSFTITSNDTYNGTVTSIGITESSAALSITGSPVTTSGNINIGFAGSPTQYVAGDGSLVTFPTIVTQAQNLVAEVYNNTGATLTKGTIVYINGGQGNLPTVTKAIATSDPTSAQTFGFINVDLTNNNNGYVTIIGRLENIDTQAFANGTQLYLSGVTAGTYTSTKPQAPIHLVYVAIVVRSHPTEGVLEVKIQNGVEMDEIHDVQITSVANGNILQYDSATSLWKNVAGTTTNIAEGTNLYYTDTRARASISTTATGLTYTSGTGILSLSAGYVIPTTSSATNWDTAYTNRITSLTTTGSSGAASLISNTLNIPNYTLAGLGGLPLTGGTLTGALNGTSATFSGTVSATGNITGNGVSIGASDIRSSSNVLTLGGTTEIIRITSAGNVGIGTSSPNRILEVATGGDTYLRVTGNRGNADDLHIGNVEFYNSNTTRIIAEVRAITGTGGTQSNSGQLAFYTNNAGTYAERMRITSGGNVGIGTSSPDWPLTVKTDASANSIKIIGRTGGDNALAFYGSDASTLYGHIDVGASYFQIYTSNSQPMQFFTGGSERMRITSGGSIEIGTTSAFLQWQGGNYWTWRTVTSGTEFWLYRGDTGAAPFIVTTGNVVRLSSLAGSGSRTVTADASGNLSASSDSSLKQEDTSHKIEGLAEILQLQPRAYKWKSDIEIRGEEATTEIGFFANEVNAIIPSAAPKGNDDLYGFYDRAVIAALVKAVQEQDAKIEELKALIAAK